MCLPPVEYAVAARRRPEEEGEEEWAGGEALVDFAGARIFDVAGALSAG